MADLLVAYDPTAPVGSRLAPEIIAEIQAVAPSTVNDDSITEPKLANNAVSSRTLEDGAVETAALADDAVSGAKIGSKQVAAANIADDTIGPEQTGNGIPTVTDSSGNPVAANLEEISSAAYTALTTPDPNTWYFIT